MPIGPIEDSDKLYSINQYMLRIIEVLNTMGGGGGGGGGLATEAKQDDAITELQSLVTKLDSLITRFLTQQLTPSISRTSVAGTIVAGKNSVSISSIGATDFIVNGVTIPGSFGAFNISTNDDFNTLDAITYDPNGGELLIVTLEV